MLDKSSIYEINIMTSSTKFIILNSLLNTKLIKKIDSQLGFHGISFSEYMIMYHLEKAPNNMLRRIDLAENVGLSASGVTRLLAPMEKNNIVEKQANPRDARVSLVKLSETGAQLFSESSITFEHSSKSLLSKLSATQSTKLLDLTQLLL